MKLWPKNDPGVFTGFHIWIRPGWIIMEVATIVVGIGYLTVVQFPFLLFPVSFSLWYLSMDLTPLITGWTKHTYITIRARVSFVVGLLMIALGYIAERGLGTEPDLGFWLYFFGLLTCWAAVNFTYPSTDTFGSLFLLGNMCLILIGSRLDRTTFYVFGTLGIIEYVGSLYISIIKASNSLQLWLLKALVAAALFAQAVRHDGNMEILAGLVCMLAFNFNYVVLLNSSELYSLLLLTTNLGFVAVSSLFARPLDLWLFTIPDIELPISLMMSLTVLLFHARVVVQHFKKQLNYASWLYMMYRIAASVCVSLLFMCLQQPHFAWVGGVGIPMVNICVSFAQNNNHRPYSVAAIFGHLFGVVFSLFLGSNLLYLICCVALLLETMAMLNRQKITGCVIAILLVLLSVPLSSKFLIAIGTFYVLSYLSHLAYVTFKNSLLFPLVLVCLGIFMIAAAIQYQRFEAYIHDTFYALLPQVLNSLLSEGAQPYREMVSVFDLSSLLSSTEFSLENFLLFPFRWIFWPGALTFALVDGPAPYVVYLCGISLLVLGTMSLVEEVWQCMRKPLDDVVKVSMAICIGGRGGRRGVRKEGGK